jgi:hypothetical protein
MLRAKTVGDWFFDRDGRLSFRGVFVIAVVEISVLASWVIWSV